MSARTLSVVALIALTSLPAMAQHAGGQPPLRTAPPEARQFAFLVGQWELDVRPPKTLAMRIHGSPKLVGTWKGWRALDGFGIEDELKVTDESGNPKTMAHVVRYYDSVQKKWVNSSLEVYRGTFATSTSEWASNTMTTMARGTDAAGKAHVTRTRFYGITASSFKFRQERSYDDGKSWDTTLDIDAKRVAAAAPR